MALLHAVLDFFSMLGLFSKLFILVISGAAVWTVLRAVVLGRRARLAQPASTETYAALTTENQTLNGVFYLAEISAVAYVADQLFNFMFVYLTRTTDSNPLLGVRDLWLALQVLMLLLLLTHCARWYVCQLTNRAWAELHK